MKPKILLVDDELNVLIAYQRNLRSRFDLSIAESGEAGLAVINESGPFAVIVSDYNMPIMNGIEFLRNVKNLAPDSIRIMLTGQADLQSAINAVNEGNVFRFLTKPCSHELLLNSLESAVEQYRLVTVEKVLLEKIKKMEKILPICSVCKKIKDANNHWVKLEKYFSDNTESQLSHGLCPDCIEKLYPGVMQME